MEQVVNAADRPAAYFPDAAGSQCGRLTGDLARAAYWHAGGLVSRGDWRSGSSWIPRTLVAPTGLDGREQWAEAEALLRTGWTP